MGKTYKKQNHRFDDETPSGRSGKHSKHTNGKKTGGMRTLNSYVEEDYDFEEDENPFEDDIAIDDVIHIQHTKNTNDTP
jgi:hypothetical protein